jgi:AraC-like DNA-binding protein
MIAGQSWLSVDGVPDAVRLEAGDCFLLPRVRAFRIASDLALPSVDPYAAFAAELDGSVFSYNGGGDCFGVGGHFDLTGDHAGILLGMLQSDSAALRWFVERMMQELRDRQPGGYLVAQHLAYMMLVQALQLHLAEGLSSRVGWLLAPADKQMNAAISAMHSEPAHRWTLQSLAERAGMSRTSFTLKFRDTVGTSPMEYLTRWRMLRAGDSPVNSDDPVCAISLSVGYESESAFSAAFRKVMGCSPRQYGRARTFGRSSKDSWESARAARLEPPAG